MEEVVRASKADCQTCALKYQCLKTPTAILSRATAGIRGKSLIINLSGNPKAIGECLPLILPAIRECLKHLQET